MLLTQAEHVLEGRGCVHVGNIQYNMWCPIQEERYEEEDGADEDILGSNFSPGRNTEVFDLPDVEALFMPANMDSSQMAFKFKEVFLDPCDLKCKSVFGFWKFQI